MSLEAYIWACDLRLDECSATSFRVLLKYADRADRFGYTAWRSVSDMADELGCSTRTIQRAIRELEEKGLMSRGDQRYVQHIRADRRPVVYDVETPAKKMRDATTSMSPRLVTG